MEPVPASSRSLLDALEQMANELTAPGPRPRASHTDQMLQRLVGAAVTSVPGTDHAGLTLYSPTDGLVSRAPSDDTVADVDALHVVFGEGPCLEVLAPKTARRIEVSDFATEIRWPRFAAGAVGLGMRSMLSFAMAAHDDRTHTALNLYACRPNAFTAAARDVAAGFATHAAVAVYGAQTIADLERALGTRDLIGQAKGILMGAHGIDAQRAFELLKRYSQQSNTKLHEVARQLVAATVSGDGGSSSG